MELVFEVNVKFEKDLKRLGPLHRRIVDRINAICSLLKHEPKVFFQHVYRPLIPHLSKGFKSSMYVLRVDRDIRVILTVDEDPIFEQIIVTLMRVVRHNDLDKSFRGIAEALYQQYLIKFKLGKCDGRD